MSQSWKDSPEGEEVQMPLGVGGDAAPVEEYTPPKQRVNTSTVALIMAFAAALVVLYFLGLQNKPRTASAEDIAKAKATDVTIEKWIKDKAAQKGVQDLKIGLLPILEKYFNEKIIAMDVANAFESFKAETPVKVPSDPVAVVVVQTEDPILKEAAQIFNGLRLQMTMLGNPSAAMINNKMVTAGATFGPLALTDIQSNHVILTCTDKDNKPRDFKLAVYGSNNDLGGFGNKPR